jgi:hypothetical protein
MIGSTPLASIISITLPLVVKGKAAAISNITKSALWRRICNHFFTSVNENFTERTGSKEMPGAAMPGEIVGSKVMQDGSHLWCNCL